MRESAIGTDIFAPYDRVSQDCDFVSGDVLLEAALKEPVIFAERIRDAVIGAGFERLNPLPETRNRNECNHDDRDGGEPLAYAEPHFIDAKRRHLHAGGRGSKFENLSAIVCISKLEINERLAARGAKADIQDHACRHCDAHRAEFQ